VRAGPLRPVTFPNDDPRLLPYRRILFWRAKHFAVRFRDLRLLYSANFGEDAHASDNSDEDPMEVEDDENDRWEFADKSHTAKITLFSKWKRVLENLNFEPDDCDTLAHEMTKSKLPPEANLITRETIFNFSARRDPRYPKPTWELHYAPDGTYITLTLIPMKSRLFYEEVNDED
jgi:hypothetical protein